MNKLSPTEYSYRTGFSQGYAAALADIEASGDVSALKVWAKRVLQQWRYRRTPFTRMVEDPPKFRNLKIVRRE